MAPNGKRLSRAAKRVHPVGQDAANNAIIPAGVPPPAGVCQEAIPEASVVNTLSSPAPVVILNPAVVKFPPIIRFPALVCSVEDTFMGAGRLELIL